MEDGEVDLLQGNLDVATGTFKMKAARNTVQMPKTPEELRLRHRRLGLLGKWPAPNIATEFGSKHCH